MAGHSKWKNIQHRKGSQDAKRGKVFTKIIREITQSARLQGGDPAANPRLRRAIDKAYDADMSKDTIENAVKRGVGGVEGTQMDEITYEGYGPGGVAVYVECMTDNRNRTVAEVRHAFTKCGGNLGTDGSVAYLFSKKGELSFASGADEERIMEIALEAGAEDIITHEDKSVEVITAPENFITVKSALEAQNIKPIASEITFIATTKAEVNERELAEKLVKMIDMLEDLDDVQNVYTNADIAEDIVESINA